MKSILIPLLIISLYSMEAVAHTIQVEPGLYSGNYSIVGETGALSGPQSIEVEPGNYSVIIGAVSSFPISVSIDGTVTTTSASAIGSAGLLTFNTAPINVQTSGYVGQWNFPSISPTLSGDLNGVHLVVEQNYLFQVAAIDSFFFFVDDTGQVSSVSKPDAVSFSGNSLQLETTPIHIDPKMYSGFWLLSSVNQLITGPLMNVLLPKGLKYLVQLDTTGSFQIEIDGSGAISVPNQVSALANGNTLEFNSFGIDVDPGSYSGTWFFSNVTQPTSGASSNIQLVPGATFRLDIDTGEVATVDILFPCDLNPQSINFSVGTFQLSCHQTSPPFICEKKMDYESETTCKGEFIADNQSELDNYLQNYGLENGTYKNLEIHFDLQGGNKVIHSPCQIKVKSDSQIEVDNLCLDGREGVKIRSSLNIQANQIVLLSEFGKTQINSYATITANSLNMEGALQTRIRSNAQVDLLGDLTLTSTGNDPVKSRAVIRPHSTITADNVSLNSSVISVVRHDSEIITTQLSLNGSQDVRIGNRVKVNSTDLNMIGGGDFSIGRKANVSVLNHFQGSGSKCDVRNNATIVSGGESGSCAPF